MKLIIFLCLTSLVFTQTVLNKNTCNACTQLKSQNDCTSGKTVLGCEWIASTDKTATTAGKCQQKPTVTFQEYCATLTTGCALKNGCAYVDSKCTHFTGCSAFTKTTTAECQAISYECVSDGTACIVASLCTDYKSQTICETTPSISGILKCKWDTTTGACRDYVCSEADSTLTTDKLCSDWLSGCLTRGKGCWTSPLPACASYTGDATTCATYIGSDGNCELATGATNCQAKVCTNALTTTATDSDCIAYQKGCITTGKGCILATVLPQCSTYSGDSSSCVGYIGSDGVCEGDAGGSVCRSRKCENAPTTYSTDADCGKYKTGCRTTGKGCIATLGACSSYQGTSTTCTGYVGTDGYCKGTSTTTSGNCTPKLCEEAPATTTTEAACIVYQLGCKSTGQGCVKALSSCTSYAGDVTSCASRIGSEGNCTWASGTNCIARTCAGALSTVNSNSNCSKWFSNCVTNGAGCVSPTTCDSTIKDVSCQGTTNCSWQSICTSNNGCSAFTTVAICTANKGRYFDYTKYTYKADGTTIDTSTNIYKFVSCAWRSGSCVKMECSDLTGTYYATDNNCSSALAGCISNKKDACITAYDCPKLAGTIDTCKGFAAYCTNVADAITTTPCVSRKCSDNTDATDTATCNSWLPGCITNGKGCSDYNTVCTSFVGTQATCNNLFGYSSGSITSFVTVQCYNVESAVATTACTVKSCGQATGKTSDNDCSAFLTGCVYNGKDSCVVFSSAVCSDYYNGSDATYCDKVSIKNQSAKYCFGTGNNGTCKTRVCSDNSTATDATTCDTFKTGCVLKSANGCDDPNNILCSSQSGTITTCPNFYGNVSSVKVKCTKADSCLDRACADIAAPTSASDCTNYKSTCRFLKSGSACIDATVCSSYNVPDTTATDAVKFAYCTGITNSVGKSCGFTKAANVCSDRTCDQFLSTYTILTCLTYYVKDVTTGTAVCKLASPTCYTPISTCAYAIDTATYTDDAKKTTYCQLFTNDKAAQCTFKTGDSTCSLQDTCEKVITATSAKICNDVVGGANKCQKGTNATGCTTTVATACSSYTLPTGTLTDPQKLAFCQSLKVVDDLAKLTLGTGVFTSCIWKTGSACDVIAACTDIPSAVSQADCDAQKSGCQFYNNKCIVPTAACTASFPSGVTTSSQKALFCLSQYDGSNFCQIKNDQSGCEANVETDCTGLTNPTTAWDGVNPATDTVYCQYHTDKTKKKPCKAGASTKCVVATCEDLPTPAGQGDCDKFLIGCKFFNSKCNTLGTGVAAAGDCALVAKVPFGANISAALLVTDKLAYCQSFSKGGTSIFCTYDSLAGSAPVLCMDATACNLYTPPSSGQLAYCNSKINDTGDKCSWTTAGGKCREWDCYDIASPQSQVDCDVGSLGLTCVYYKGTCYNKTTGCDIIPVVGTTAAEKKAYCEALTAATKVCRYVAGTTCAPTGSCSTYTVSSLASASDKLTACNTLSDGTNACTFIQTSAATACAQLDTCDNYTVDTGSETAQCAALKSTAGFPCKKDATPTATKCDPVACEDITTGTADCSNNATGCLYYSSACITKKACASYAFPSSVNTDALKTAWCTGVTDTSGNLCKWDGTKCADRTCADVKLYTDNDCKTYLKTCKTDGIKCVASSTACNTLSGDSNFCNYISDTTFLDKCKVTTPASTTSGACTARTCYDNVSSTSDSECNTHMSGCVTRGIGCIPNTASCDQYRGTKTTCEGFKQYISTDANGVITYKYCSGDAANTATSACKNRVCADNTTATDDTTCSGYLTGCVTNGAGCIEYTASCTSYKGTVSQCAKFMGSSGQDYCFATATDATTVVACRKKLCTDIGGANDKDCYNGMKPLKNAAGKDIFTFCVYDGTNCTDNNKSCSQFKGDVDTCATYTASVDGPCKATTIGSTKGTCAKRVCTEAPNTLTTDADCLLYHSGCYTTGYGCTSNQTCSNLTNQASCSSRVECTWTNLCKTAITTCSTFSNTSQSQCMNTKVNGYYCAWSETGSLCRTQTCADQPATIKDHATCQAFSAAQTTTNCTTSGAGCITIGLCSTYTVQSVCLAASTSKDGVGRCGWENNACRARACGDKQATSDAECDTFLSGCKTNGSTCVSANSCTDFTGNQAYCQTSKKGPCLYIGSICYDYTQCEDAPGKSHQTCQTFSPQCTTNGTNCVTITSCAATTLKVSCVVGTDGQCGWLPAGGSNSTEKCMKFGQCTDAVATTNEACSAYGSSCVTDGTGCIAVSTCSAYKTQISCSNLGTDGLCFWNSTTSSCKLKDCGDATANNTTNDGCASFTVASGSCTTDGTKCIPLSTCSSYVEAGCFQGTDGVCTFALAVGVTTGTTKSCRLKACEDIKDGISNSVCVGILPKKCVSNGTICISKAACTSYTTKTACNGGGVDTAGNNVVCAFTVTDATKPNIGTCKQFSQCTDANSDQTACQTKTGICIWNGATTGSSCKAFACDTITTGTSCQPVPSFDGLSQTVCNLVNGKCTAADPGTITDTNCYAKSAYTYSWNTATSKCESCVAGSTTPTNNTTNTNNTNTTTNDTTTTYGYLLGAMTLGLLGFMA